MDRIRIQIAGEEAVPSLQAEVRLGGESLVAGMQNMVLVVPGARAVGPNSAEGIGRRFEAAHCIPIVPEVVAAAVAVEGEGKPVAGPADRGRVEEAGTIGSVAEVDHRAVDAVVDSIAVAVGRSLGHSLGRVLVLHEIACR